MDDKDRALVMQAWGSSILGFTALEMSLAVLCDEGAVQQSHLDDIVHRLNAFVDDNARNAPPNQQEAFDFMKDRLSRMAERLSVNLQKN